MQLLWPVYLAFPRSPVIGTSEKIRSKRVQLTNNCCILMIISNNNNNNNNNNTGRLGGF